MTVRTGACPSVIEPDAYGSQNTGTSNSRNVVSFALKVTRAGSVPAAGSWRT
jgi:hypothetical protein